MLIFMYRVFFFVKFCMPIVSMETVLLGAYMWESETNRSIGEVVTLCCLVGGYQSVPVGP
jgi:hypothetical protein